MIATCYCQKCEQPIEFEVENKGAWIHCPHCGGGTALGMGRYVSKPKNHSNNSKKWMLWLIVPAIICSMWILARLGIVRGEAMAGIITSTLAISAAICIYFLPAALGMNKRNSTAILLLNLLLGWTLVGWVVALVWAATKDPEK